MVTARPALSLLAAALLLHAAASAQQRRPMLGTVTGPDGGPVAGAEVVCSFTLAGAENGLAADVQRATTDERGRFRADVFACTRYHVWALGPADDDGARLATEVTDAAAGRLLELRAVHRQPPTTMTLDGLDAWQDLAPFQLRISFAATQLDTPRIAVIDGVAVIPPQPRDRCNLDLIGADGQVLLSHPVTLSRAEHQLPVPPPQQLPVRVVDGDGKPVAGATVRLRLSGGWVSNRGFGPSAPSRMLWRELGRTDDEGRLTARLPQQEPPLQSQGWQQLFFLAEKDGYRSSHSGFTDELFVDGVEVARDGVEELRFTLKADEPLRGRVQFAGQGVAGLPITVVVGLRTESRQGNGWRNEELVRSLTTDADGSFELRGLTNVEGANVHVDCARLYDRLVPEQLRRMAPYAPLARHRTTTPIDKSLQVTLDDLQPLKLQLLDLEGGPAAGTEVLLLPGSGDEASCDSWTPCATTDSAGRLAMLLQPGKWLLFARTARGMVHQQLQVDGAQELSLQMLPMPAMVGRLVDADGKPVVGATMEATGGSWSSGNDDDDESLQRIAQHLNWNWIARTRTDADGRFVCTFLDLPNMSYRARFRLDQRLTPEFVLETGDGDQTFVLQ